MKTVLWMLLLLQDFRSSVALVHVDAEVRQSNQVVDGLSKEDFQVTDNGKPQPIVAFGHQDQPLDVLLLFDTSASMGPVVERVADAAHMALGELHSGDRVAIMAFDCRIDLILDLTEDLDEAERSIRERVLKRRFRRCSPIQKALLQSAGPFETRSQSNRRRAVVIITDDAGTRRENGAVEALWKAGAVVLGVIVRNPNPGVNIRIAPPRGYTGVRNIAEKTGGDAINAADAALGLQEMIHRLRLRYSLYYSLPPGKSGQEHKIKVQLTKEAASRNPGAIVRARSGYVR